MKLQNENVLEKIEQINESFNNMAMSLGETYRYTLQGLHDGRQTLISLIINNGDLRNENNRNS